MVTICSSDLQMSRYRGLLHGILYCRVDLGVQSCTISFHCPLPMRNCLSCWAATWSLTAESDGIRLALLARRRRVLRRADEVPYLCKYGLHIEKTWDLDGGFRYPPRLWTHGIKVAKFRNQLNNDTRFLQNDRCAQIGALMNKDVGLHGMTTRENEDGGLCIRSYSSNYCPPEIGFALRDPGKRSSSG